MTRNPETSLTIDTHHHILPNFFWRETNDSHDPVGGLAPMEWSKEAMISFMDIWKSTPFSEAMRHAFFSVCIPWFKVCLRTASHEDQM